MKRLDRYVASTVVLAFGLVSLALTLLFSLLAFVEQLRDVGHGHYGVINAFGYVLFTAPARLVELAPVSTLLAALLGLGSLAAHGELTAMNAAGVSELRIAGWVLKVGVPVMAALFLVAEFVVPKAYRLAESERAAALSPAAALRSDNGFWARGDQDILHVRHFVHETVPTDIDIYTFDATGHLRRYIHAARAEVGVAGRWQLQDVLVKDLDDDRITTRRRPQRVWHSFLRPQQLRLMTLPPERMGPIQLFRYLRDRARRGQSAPQYVQALWQKLSIPLSCAVMVLIAIPFVFGPTRAHGAGQRIMIGALVGVGFSLVGQISNNVGLLFDLSPAGSAMLPSLLVLLLAAALFWRRR